MIAKRIFDLLASGVGLVLLSPFLLLIAIAIKLETPGPVFFRQERVGRDGRIFQIYKFRTMVAGAEYRGSLITAGSDARVTRVGAILRRYKLDELAQLMNILAGHMSLVGPRPEVPQYVAYYPDDIRALVLSVRPGIADRASIAYRHENELLGKAEDPHLLYVQEVLPAKLRFCADYVRNRSFWGDIAIIFATLWALVHVGRGRPGPMPS